MSDNFIPLNQSTPVQHQWNQGRPGHNNSGFRNHYFQNRGRGRRGQGNQWGNKSWTSSFSSDNNSYSNNSSNSTNIDAYLHPSMLQDPWAQLRKRKEEVQQV